MENNKVIFQIAEERSLYLRFKRLGDFVFALLALLFLFPLFILVALVIKMTDLKAPIIFKQVRVGRNGSNFQMYKFRTMRPNAETELAKYLELNEIKGAMFKMKRDPRVTPIGRFLRKTSIDEFPQLWNVIRGEMSLVGPRPPLPREVEMYSAYDKMRLTVTPGCTGLWQVSGRNQIGFAEMVELDLTYIQHMSFLNDLKILARTILVVLAPKGAY
ncbi:sugar transferase [Listeria aquatica]|uniref:Priming glycosyltransferase n=2 Tax=Listeria aquatica TaxID=1494960 RepID=W7BIP7_9LIST|nr:sugar transferase [Listeria aquatica]EUJ19643.1 priming glycosyltransferase [Listeria aquatica FSL S10-1188]MBC1520512.1 sugar transferase [Listeria aquatica]